MLTLVCMVAHINAIVYMHIVGVYVYVVNWTAHTEELYLTGPSPHTCTHLDFIHCLVTHQNQTTGSS